MNKLMIGLAQLVPLPAIKAILINGSSLTKPASILLNSRTFYLLSKLVAPKTVCKLFSDGRRRRRLASAACFLSPPGSTST